MRLSNMTLNIGPNATSPAAFRFTGHNLLGGEVHAGQTLKLELANDSGSIQMPAAGGLVNHGSILTRTTGFAAPTLTLPSGALVNSETGLLHFQSGGQAYPELNGNLVNHGEVLIHRPINFRKPSGLYTNYGQFTISTSSTLWISFQGNFEQRDGVTLLNGEILTNGPVRYFGGRLTGKGTIDAPVVENLGATFDTGSSVGRLTIDGNYLQSNSGLLGIKIGGVSSYDVLDVTGSAALGGTLDVSLIVQYAPVAGNSFEILRVAGGVSGLFDAVLLPSLNEGLVWSVAYAANSVFLNVATAPPGDFDSDGDVDGADFVVWQTNFPAASGKTLSTGDADADGDVDGADFIVWQTNFPSPPVSVTSPVPEPASCILAFGSLLIALGRRRS
jgi:hypothetical protein